jgi:hypothetical protein
MVMTRLFLTFVIALPLCGFAAEGFAQASPPLSSSDPLIDGAAKAHAGKAVRKNGGAAARKEPNSEEAEKAARLAEGRKKFFDRSMGFDNGGGPNSPITFDGGNGLTPSAGFKF